MPIDPARRKFLRAKALERLRVAHAHMGECQDGAACYVIECALDEITSQELAPRDESVIPLAGGNAVLRNGDGSPAYKSRVPNLVYRTINE